MLPNIKQLILSYTGLAYIHSNAFLETNRLRSLDLSNNDLITLGKSLRGVKSLKILNISNNDQQKFDEMTLTGVFLSELPTSF